jgi:hypothetical protein
VRTTLEHGLAPELASRARHPALTDYVALFAQSSHDLQSFRLAGKPDRAGIAVSQKRERFPLVTLLSASLLPVHAAHALAA